jgi:excisionase family DNA binding protein
VTKNNLDLIPLLTISNVADHCQVSEKTVRRWIEAKELAAAKLGSQWRIDVKDLKLFLRDRFSA